MPNLETGGCSTRLMYWNCRGAISKKPDIERLSEITDTLILAETCVTQIHNFRLWKYNSIRLHHVPGGARGLIIFLKNDITYQQIDTSSINDSSIEMIIFQIFTDTSSVMVAGIYRHPNMVTSADTYNKIFSILEKSNQFLIMGDLNSHHPLWGSRRV